MNYNKLIDHISNWLKEMVEKTNSKGLLVGISGGIDSAVVAALIKKAMGENSLGVVLPILSSNSSIEDSKKLIEAINIKALTIDLTNEHILMLNKTTEILNSNSLFNKNNIQLTDANLRARLRMTILYTIANNLNYMVVGTDNLEETFTGYFTKYGDGAVDLMPLKKIHKSHVYEMGKILNVPNSIINKAPSADLWPDQTDEKEMGVSYEKISNYIDGKTENINEKDLKIIENLHKRSEHKRNLPPYFDINYDNYN